MKKVLYRLLVTITIITTILYTVYYIFPSFEKSDTKTTSELIAQKIYRRDFDNLSIDTELKEKFKMTEDYLAIYPDSLAALTSKAFLYMHDNKMEECILINQRVLEIHPNLNIAVSNTSWAYNYLGNHILALHYADKAISINTNGMLFYEYLNKGDANFYSDRLEDAIFSYETAISSYESIPDDTASQLVPYALSNLGRCYKDKNDTQMAIKTYLKLFTYEQNDISAFQSLVSLYTDNNVDGMKDVLNIYNSNINLWSPETIGSNASVVAEAYKEFGLALDAAKYYVIAAKNTGYEDYKAYYYYEAAIYYATAGENENAKSNLEEAIKLDSSLKESAAKEKILEVLYE